MNNIVIYIIMNIRNNYFSCYTLRLNIINQQFHNMLMNMEKNCRKIKTSLVFFSPKLSQARL